MLKYSYQHRGRNGISTVFLLLLNAREAKKMYKKILIFIKV